MKRVFSVILILCLLTACLPVGVQAAEASLSISCAQAYSAGQTFTVEIKANQIVNCCVISARLVYDAERLEAISVERGTAFSGGFWEENPEIADNAAYFSLIGTTEQSLQGTLAKVTFRAKSDVSGPVQFGFEDVCAYNIQSRAIDVIGGTAQTNISALPAATLQAVAHPMADGAVELKVSMSEGNYFCGMWFKMTYDPQRYTVRSMTQSSKLPENVIVTQNPQFAEGKLLFSLASVEEVSYDGQVVSIVFDPKQGTADAAPFGVEELALCDGKGEAMPIEWSFTPGAVIDCAKKGNTINAEVALLNLSAQAKEYTVIAAVYAENDQMLSVAVSAETVQAGKVETFELSVPAKTEATYVKVYFLNDSLKPVAVAASELQLS